MGSHRPALRSRDALAGPGTGSRLSRRLTRHGRGGSCSRQRATERRARSLQRPQLAARRLAPGDTVIRRPRLAGLVGRGHDVWRRTTTSMLAMSPAPDAGVRPARRCVRGRTSCAEIEMEDDGVTFELVKTLDGRGRGAHRDSDSAAAPTRASAGGHRPARGRLEQGSAHVAERDVIEVSASRGRLADPWPTSRSRHRVPLAPVDAGRWLMTQLHTVHRGLGVVRPTNDVDIVLHIEAARGVPAEAAALSGVHRRSVRRDRQ